MSVASGHIAPIFCNFFMSPSCLYLHTQLAHNHCDIPQVNALYLLAGKINTANSTIFWKCVIAVI